MFFIFFFFNDTATTEIYTLSLHDALPIYCGFDRAGKVEPFTDGACRRERSEEHTSELQSPPDLVCRLLLEKKRVNTCAERATPPLFPCLTSSRVVMAI